MNRRHVAVLAKSLLFAIAMLSSIGGRDEFQLVQAQESKDELNLRKRFLEEGPRQWEEYANRAKHLQGTITTQAKVVSPRHEVTIEDSYIVKKNDGCRLIELKEKRTIKGQEKRFEIFGVNRVYAFNLRRGAPASPWTVTELIDLRKHPPSHSMETYFDGFHKGATGLVQFHPVLRKSLVEVLKHPGFRVVRCRKIPKAGEEYVEVAFHYAPDGGKGVQEGTLLFDPQRFWCLCASDLQTKDEDSALSRKWVILEFGETAGSLPVPKLAVLESTEQRNDGSKTKATWRFAYDLRIPSPLPADEEFTLTAFGLAEPAWLERRGAMPRYIWFGLAGIIFLVLAVGFRWLKKRAAKKP